MSESATPTQNNVLMDLARDSSLIGRAIKIEESPYTACGVITEIRNDDHGIEISVAGLMYLMRDNGEIVWGPRSSEIVVYSAAVEVASAYDYTKLDGTFRVMARVWNADILPAEAPVPTPGRL